MVTVRNVEVSSQWVGLQEVIEATSEGQNISIEKARIVLSQLCLDEVKPLLSLRGGTGVIVTDIHDRTYNQSVAASLSLKSNVYSYDTLVTAAYSDFCFSIPSLLEFFETSGLNVETTTWKKWMLDSAPALRSRGLLFLSNAPKTSRETNFGNSVVLSPDDAAEYLGIGRSLFNSYVKPKINTLKFGHRTVRVTRRSLDEFVENRIASSACDSSKQGTDEILWLHKKMLQGQGETLEVASSSATATGTSTNALAELEFGKALERLTEV